MLHGAVQVAAILVDNPKVVMDHAQVLQGILGQHLEGLVILFQGIVEMLQQFRLWPLS
jgi:hypothetical protein